MSEPPASAPDRRRKLLRWAREALVLVVLVFVASTALGRLRAPELPEQAPDFTLPDLEGRAVRLADFRGQVVVLNFWATWCRPCRVEIPMLSRFARANPDIVVLGVAVDGTRQQLARAAPGLGVDYPVLVGDAAVQQLYGASTVPTTVIVDKRGAVVSAHVGLLFRLQLWWMTLGVG